MTEAPGSTSAQEGLPAALKPSHLCKRKSGRSNIFAGVDLSQLYRLFRAAGDRDAQRRAKLALQGGDEDAAAGGTEQEAGEGRDEAALARALVGLRVRARTKGGVRAGGHGGRRRLGASGSPRFAEPSPGSTSEEESEEEEEASANPRPCKPSPPRARQQEVARDSERYLHHILH